MTMAESTQQEQPPQEEDEKETLDTTIHTSTTNVTSTTYTSVSSTTNLSLFDEDSAFLTRNTGEDNDISQDGIKDGLDSTHYRPDAGSKDCLDFVFEKIEQVACTMDGEKETIKDILDDVFEYFEEIICGEEARERNAAFRESFESFLQGIDHLASLVPKDSKTKDNKSKDLLDVICQHFEKSKCQDSDTKTSMLNRLVNKGLIDEIFEHIEGGLCNHQRKEHTGSGIQEKKVRTLLSDSEESQENERLNQPLFKISEEGSIVSETSSRASVMQRAARRERIRKELALRNNLRKLRGSIHGHVSTRDVVKKVTECRDTVHEAFGSAGAHLTTAGAQLSTIFEQADMEKFWEVLVLGHAVNASPTNKSDASSQAEALTSSSPSNEVEAGIYITQDQDSALECREAYHTQSDSIRDSENVANKCHHDEVVSNSSSSDSYATSQRSEKDWNPPQDKQSESCDAGILKYELKTKMNEVGRWTPNSAATEQTYDETLSETSSAENGNTDVSLQKGSLDSTRLERMEMLVCLSSPDTRHNRQSDSRRTSGRFNRTLSLDGAPSQDSSSESSTVDPSGRKFSRTLSLDHILASTTKAVPERYVSIPTSQFRLTPSLDGCSTIGSMEPEGAKLRAQSVRAVRTTAQEPEFDANSLDSDYSIEEMPSIPYIQTAQSSILVEETTPLEVEAAIVEDSDSYPNSRSLPQSDGQSVSSGSVFSAARIRTVRARTTADDAPDDELHLPGRRLHPTGGNLPKASNASLSMIPRGNLFTSIADMFKSNKGARWYENKYNLAFKVIMLMIYVGMSVASSGNSSFKEHIEKRKRQLKEKMLNQKNGKCAELNLMSTLKDEVKL